jgi:hypothetical protein
MPEKTRTEDLPKDTPPPLPADDEKTQAKVETAVEKGKDYGDWEYRPWQGRDHWVHKKTGASTFDLRKVR